jgi:hypothetical protein
VGFDLLSSVLLRGTIVHAPISGGVKEDFLFEHFDIAHTVADPIGTSCGIERQS